MSTQHLRTARETAAPLYVHDEAYAPLGKNCPPAKVISELMISCVLNANAACSDALLHLNPSHVFALMTFRSMK